MNSPDPAARSRPPLFRSALISAVATVVAVCLAGIPAPAAAAPGDIVFTEWSCQTSPSTPTEVDLPFSIEPWDPADGAFLGIEVTGEALITTSLTMLNRAPGSQSFRISGTASLWGALAADPSVEATMRVDDAPVFDTGTITLTSGESRDFAGEPTDVVLPTYSSSNAALWADGFAQTVRIQSLMFTRLTGGGSAITFTQRSFATATVCHRFQFVEPFPVVTPLAPTLSMSPQCGVEATVVIPVVTGVTYSQARVADVVEVTATVDAGYVLAPGAVTFWSLTIPPVVVCPDPPSPPDPPDPDLEVLPPTGSSTSALGAAIGMSLLSVGVILTLSPRRGRSAHSMR